MQVIVNRQENKAVEFIDGFPILTDTPTLLTDNATLESCLKSSNDLYNVNWNTSEYELRKCNLIIK